MFLYYTFGRSRPGTALAARVEGGVVGEALADAVAWATVAQNANAVELHHWGTTHGKKGWQTHRGAMPTREQGFKPKFLHAIVIARLKANSTKRTKPQYLLLSTVHKSNCRDASRGARTTASSPRND